MWLGQDPYFWLAVAGAVIVKLITSAYHSIWRALATVFAAVFFAYFFTEPALAFLSLDAETYKVPLAALLALTGEGFIRMVLGWMDNPDFLTSVIRAWRGK